MEILAVILLGSNTGDRSLYLRNAMDGLAGLGKTDRVSAVYETSAWGLTDQNNFLNMVAGIYTRMPAHDLLKALLGLEIELGRVRDQRWGPRTIDLDLLYYGQSVIDEPGLRVPHPGIPERRFTLVPLASLYPEYNHPELGISTDELLKRCTDNGNVYFYTSAP